MYGEKMSRGVFLRRVLGVGGVAMVASVLLGLLVGRSVIKTDALVRTGDEELVAVVAPVLQRIVNGD